MTNFRTLSIVFAVLTVVFIATTGYFASASSTASTRTSTQTVVQTTTVNGPPQQVPSLTTITVSGSGGPTSTVVDISYKSSLGFYLSNSTRWTLYLFTNDTQNSGKSSCYGQCATFWPAFHVSSNSLTPPQGVNASSFSTIARSDGTKQLAYEGWPLYYYAGDKAAGQTNGQGKFGTWFVLNIPSLKIPSNTTAGSATA